MADFNGDGYPDLASGARTQDRGGVADAGLVLVYLGSERGFQPWRRVDDDDEGGPIANAYFGEYLYATDIGDDGFGDLFIGYGGSVPDRPIFWYRGGPDGLTLERVWTISELDSLGQAVATSDLGFAWASGDLDGDGDTDLAVSAPGYHSESGKVFVFRSEGDDLILDYEIDPTIKNLGVMMDVTSSGQLMVTSRYRARVLLFDEGVQVANYTSP